MTHTPKTFRPAAACALLLAALAGRDCSCDGNTPQLREVEAYSCTELGRRPGPDVVACADGERFAKGQCVPARCDAGQVGCCPGTNCNAGGLCVVAPRFTTPCTDDGDCTTPGHRCLDRPLINPDAKTCGYARVDSSGQCPEGAVPFNHRCVTRPPCGGGCNPGTVCNIDLDTCEIVPDSATASCQTSCGVAEMLVYADPDNMLFEQCCVVECGCAAIPPLSPGNWGSYSSLAVGDDALLISAYDATYGDLVVARHGLLGGELESIAYVDGVPTSGAVVANPNGPRGGRSALGPDVGTHTALALHQGEPRVAYYDEDERVLKYATRAGGAWAVAVVDDGRGEDFDSVDVGQYASLAVDDAGIAHVTYYAHRVSLGGELATTPMYARAKVVAPSSYDDWDHVPVDPLLGCGECPADTVCAFAGATPSCVPQAEGCAGCTCDEVCVDDGGPTCMAAGGRNVLLPCDGFCPGGSKCVSDLAGGTECRAESVGSCGTCASGNVCVAVGSGFGCRPSTPYSTIDGLPQGNGVFTSLVLHDGYATLVYFDNLRGHLRGATATFASDEPVGAFAVGPLDCAPGVSVGQHASLARGEAGLVVAYQAYDGETLRLWRGTDLLDVTATIEEIDDGVRGVAETHLVGAYASVAVDSLDRVFVAYADQTSNDLLLSYWDGVAWQRDVLLGGDDSGAYGAFARLAIVDDIAYVSSYYRHRTGATNIGDRITLRIIDLSGL